ncbi:PEP-CTERM sorting domain-containing protein [Desulfoluna sp.]|uniref:PEP-CTERM sorting domain-containing protein n=1 Tax=Desulfoluna sp. TaxID=2045199 RepID=UPI00260FC58A|nr:PEP-CTERM sorting domain-containing protein [Desulfoluna sp.]
MKKKLFVSLVWVLLLCVSRSADATPVRYDVCGKASLCSEAPGGVLACAMSGYLFIDDVMNVEDNYEIYYINQFEIELGEYSFYGDSGSIKRSEHDDYLSLDGQGDWTHWGFDNCCNHVGAGLPDIMKYKGDYGHQCSQDLDGFHIGGDSLCMKLTRSQAPVPEPSTVFLFCTGFLAIFGHRFKRKKREYPFVVID